MFRFIYGGHFTSGQRSARHRHTQFTVENREQSDDRRDGDTKKATMPSSCACYGCSNRWKSGTSICFHRFPFHDNELLQKWCSRVSRDHFKPTKYHYVCSEHFKKEDYLSGVHPRDDRENYRHTLTAQAVPSLFPCHPPLKQPVIHQRKPPIKRSLPAEDTVPSEPSPKRIHNDHSYNLNEELMREKLQDTQKRLAETTKELKSAKRKIKTREKNISSLLKKVRDQSMISKSQLDMLNENFDESTLVLIENELKSLKHSTQLQGMRYSDDLKKFAVTVHFYSAQAYEYLRKFLHLPHPSTIRRWCSSIDCKPGFLTEVIQHIKEKVEQNEYMKDCMLMLDGMALKKEVVFDPKSGSYAGFVDCGNFQPSSGDDLASEALVFMVVGLTGHWKYPVAYYVTDHLGGEAQSEIIKQLICILTDAGLKVRGVVCDGSYANQYTSSLLGCSLIPGRMQTYFKHPSNPDENIHFLFDACHLVKLVRNNFAQLGVLYQGGDRISWEYITKLQKLQEKDNLNLANKLTCKHIQWQQHKMNVKTAVQTLSSSVADAIDFCREDLKLPDFAGSQATTAFIRRIDRLFDYLNSKSTAGKGFKSPMTLNNFDERRRWMLQMKEYIASLKDPSGARICFGRRKTAWVGLMITISSVLHICEDLLTCEKPFKYVLTFKMSQDHLEMFFSRIRRRNGWNNNPNCLQFKWSLRAILLKNDVMPSKKGNSVIDEPLNTVFHHSPSSSSIHLDEHLQKFAELLSTPSEYHDHVLHYMSGYVSRHVIRSCKCTQCSLALHRNAPNSLHLTGIGSFTERKTEGA